MLSPEDKDIAGMEQGGSSQFSCETKAKVMLSWPAHSWRYLYTYNLLNAVKIRLGQSGGTPKVNIATKEDFKCQHDLG